MTLCSGCNILEFRVTRDLKKLLAIVKTSEEEYWALYDLQTKTLVKKTNIDANRIVNLGNHFAILSKFVFTHGHYKLVDLEELLVKHEFPSNGDNYPNNYQKFSFYGEGEQKLIWNKSTSKRSRSNCLLSFMDTKNPKITKQIIWEDDNCYGGSEMAYLPRQNKIILNSIYSWDLQSEAVTSNFPNMHKYFSDLLVKDNEIIFEGNFSFEARSQTIIKKDLSLPQKEWRHFYHYPARGYFYFGSNITLFIEQRGSQYLASVGEHNWEEVDIIANLVPAYTNFLDGDLLGSSRLNSGRFHHLNYREFPNKLRTFDFDTLSWQTIVDTSHVRGTSISQFDYSANSELYSVFGWYNVFYYTNMLQVINPKTGEEVCNSGYLRPEHRRPAKIAEFDRDHWLVTDYVTNKAQVYNKWTCTLKEEIDFNFSTAGCIKVALTSFGKFLCQNDQNALLSYDLSSTSSKTISENIHSFYLTPDKRYIIYLVKPKASDTTKKITATILDSETKTVASYTLFDEASISSAWWLKLDFLNNDKIAYIMEDATEIRDLLSGRLLQKFQAASRTHAVFEKEAGQALIIEDFGGRAYWRDL